METEKNYTPITLRTFIGLTMTDIDIFLLKEEDQETDIKKFLTVEEVRNQLEKTMDKMVDMATKLGVDVDAILKFDVNTRMETISQRRNK